MKRNFNIKNLRLFNEVLLHFYVTYLYIIIFDIFTTFHKATMIQNVLLPT